MRAITAAGDKRRRLHRQADRPAADVTCPRRRGDRAKRCESHAADIGGDGSGRARRRGRVRPLSTRRGRLAATFWGQIFKAAVDPGARLGCATQFLSRFGVADHETVSHSSEQQEHRWILGFLGFSRLNQILNPARSGGSALRPPLDSGVSEARMQAPDAEMRRGNEMGCLTS